MNFPANIMYTKSHEWIKDLGNGLFEVGLSDYAQKELGDIVYVNLPHTGDELKEGESFADLESVKAVSEILSPLNGTVMEVNNTLSSAPDSINKTPYEAWLIRAKGTIHAGKLLSGDEYKASINCRS